jgi:hypothetical protein
LLFNGFFPRSNYLDWLGRSPDCHIGVEHVAVWGGKKDAGEWEECAKKFGGLFLLKKWSTFYRAGKSRNSVRPKKIFHVTAGEAKFCSPPFKIRYFRQSGTGTLWMDGGSSGDVSFQSDNIISHKNKQQKKYFFRLLLLDFFWFSGPPSSLSQLLSVLREWSYFVF